MVRNLMVNEKLDDQRIVEKIICYLSARFDYVVAIIEKKKGNFHSYNWRVNKFIVFAWIRNESENQFYKFGASPIE